MLTSTSDQTIETLNIVREIEIAAPIDITFQAVLDEIGPEGTMPDGKPFPMKLEPWPGGRWYRDLGKGPLPQSTAHGDPINAGHLWGHVQVIKPPGLLELVGPMPMSYPAVNHIQYRLTAEGGGTRLKLTHKAMGLILPEHRDGMPEGWEHGLERIRQLAESRTAACGKK